MDFVSFVSFLSCPALRYTMTIDRLFSPPMVTSEPEVEIIEMILIHSRTSAWSHYIEHTLYWHSHTIHVLYSHIKVYECRSVVPSSLWPHGLYNPWNSPGHNTGVSSRSLLLSLLWIFPTQGLNPGIPHCRQILNQLNHQGGPRRSLESVQIVSRCIFLSKEAWGIRNLPLLGGSEGGWWRGSPPRVIRCSGHNPQGPQ